NVQDYVDYESWATRWDADGTAHLLSSGSYPSADAVAINSSGLAVGRDVKQAAKWLPSGAMTLLQPGPAGPYASGFTATAVNDNGLVAGTGFAAWGTWNGTSFVPLPTPPLDPQTSGAFAAIHGVSGGGTIVGS